MKLYEERTRRVAVQINSSAVIISSRHLLGLFVMLQSFGCDYLGSNFLYI